MSEPIFLSNVRVSFPHLVEPHRAKPTAKLKYQVDLIIRPDDPAWQTIMQRVQQVAQQKYGEHAPQMLQMINNDRMKRCFGKGEEKLNKNTMAPYEGYAGHMYLSVKNKKRPQIIRPDGVEVDSTNDMAYTQEAGKIYGGCYVNAAVDLYTSKQNDGVFGGLLGIQFAKDGDSFGDAAPSVSAMFGKTAEPTAPAAPATPFGQATAPASEGMPAAPFSPPGMPGFMGGND